MNRIPASEFRGVGEALHVGDQTNINHTYCPSGEDTRKRLYVKRVSGLILAYCHNCGGYGVCGLDGNKIKRIDELLAKNEEYEKEGAPEIVLPPDVDHVPPRWHPSARAWLMKYDIDIGEIYRHGICYSPSWHRVILPVYNGDKLVFWQGRALDGDVPKYVSAKTTTRPLFTVQTSRRTVYGCVIVEDYLSAVKFGRHIDSIALLGTSADINDLTQVLSRYKQVGIALDPDLAGREKATELCTRLGLTYPGSVRLLTVSRQPKELHDSTLAKVASTLRGF